MALVSGSYLRPHDCLDGAGSVDGNRRCQLQERARDNCRHHQRQRARRILDYHILSNDSYGAGIWRKYHRGYCKVSNEQVGKATPRQVPRGRPTKGTRGRARGRPPRRDRMESAETGSGSKGSSIRRAIPRNGRRAAFQQWNWGRVIVRLLQKNRAIWLLQGI